MQIHQLALLAFISFPSFTSAQLCKAAPAICKNGVKNSIWIPVCDSFPKLFRTILNSQLAHSVEGLWTGARLVFADLKETINVAQPAWLMGADLGLRNTAIKFELVRKCRSR